MKNPELRVDVKSAKSITGNEVPIRGTRIIQGDMDPNQVVRAAAAAFGAAEVLGAASELSRDCADRATHIDPPSGNNRLEAARRLLDSFSHQTSQEASSR